MIVARLFRCFPAYPNETQIGEAMKVYTEVLSSYSVRALRLTADDFSRGKVLDWKLGQRPTTDVLARRAAHYDEQIKRSQATPVSQIQVYIDRFQESGVWPDGFGPPPGHPNFFAGDTPHCGIQALSR